MVSLCRYVPQSIFTTRNLCAHIEQTYCNHQSVFSIFALLSSLFRSGILQLLPFAILEECGYVIDILRVSKRPAAHKCSLQRWQVDFTSYPVREMALSHASCRSCLAGIV